MLALLLFTLTAHAQERHCSLQPADIVRATQPVANMSLARLRAFSAKKFPGSRLSVGSPSVAIFEYSAAAVYPVTLITRDGRTLLVHTEATERLAGLALPVEVRDTGFLSRCPVEAQDSSTYHLPVTFDDRAGHSVATMYLGTFHLSPDQAYRDFGPHGCLENCPANDDGSPGICSPVDMCDQTGR